MNIGGGVLDRILRCLGTAVMIWHAGLVAAAEEGKKDPHWQGQECVACHRVTRPAKGEAPLRDGDETRLCLRCHDQADAHIPIHPVDLQPSNGLLKRMPEAFRRLRPGTRQMACTACHDPLLQCDKAKAAERPLNPGFLRGGPYRFRTDPCYQCHDRSAYQRLNAHDQVDEQGNIRKNRCRLCHRKVPTETPDGQVKNAGLSVAEDYKQICLNCHVWVVHPGGGLPFMDRGGTNHLKIPPQPIRQRLEEMQEKNEVLLPREADGRIYCATCHNPHERGVVKNIQAAKGADEKNRLRMRPICDNCHDI